jgi:hypothetical protein
MKRTFVVQVGEKKFKHKSSATNNAALIDELSTKYALKSSQVALALWHAPTELYRRPMPELSELDADSLIKVKVVDVSAVDADVVVMGASDNDDNNNDDDDDVDSDAISKRETS